MIYNWNMYIYTYIYTLTSGILWVCMGIEWGYRDERGHKLRITYVYIYYIYIMENSTKSHPQFIENQTTAGIESCWVSYTMQR